MSALKLADGNNLQSENERKRYRRNMKGKYTFWYLSDQSRGTKAGEQCAMLDLLRPQDTVTIL